MSKEIGSDSPLNLKPNPPDREELPRDDLKGLFIMTNVTSKDLKLFAQRQQIEDILKRNCLV